MFALRVNAGGLKVGARNDSPVDVKGGVSGAFRAFYGVPAPPLGRFIRCFWEVEGALAVREKILPRAELVVCVNLGDDQAVIGPGRRTRYSGSWLAGLQPGPLIVEACGHNWLCGARLTVDGARRLFGNAAAAAAAAVVGLSDIRPQWALQLESDVRRAPTPAARFHAMEAAFARLEPAPESAIDSIIRAVARGERRAIGELAKLAGLRRQSLHQRFTRAVGMAPKRLQRLVRFDAALALLQDGALNLAAVAADSGYVDEAHLAKEFRMFSGASPGAYRRARLAVDDPGFARA